MERGHLHAPCTFCKNAFFAHFLPENLRFFPLKSDIVRNHLNSLFIFVKFTKKKFIPKFCSI